MRGPYVVGNAGTSVLEGNQAQKGHDMVGNIWGLGVSGMSQDYWLQHDWVLLSQPLCDWQKNPLG